MLTKTFFDYNDTARLQNGYKKYRIVSYLLLIVGVPVEFLIGYLASRKHDMLFWPFVLLGLIILLLGFYVIFFKRLKSFKQDLAEQTKLVGDLKVISKSTNDKQLVIGFDSDDLPKIAVSRTAFDKIQVGDTVSIEFSKYAQYVFKLSKAGEIIINGG